MNLAVLYYKDVQNDELIPTEWPAQVQNLGDSTKLPQDGKPWVLMSDIEYKAYIAIHLESKEFWNAKNYKGVTEGTLTDISIKKNGRIPDAVVTAVSSIKAINKT